MPASPKWDQSFTTRLGAGYKDNILLGRDFPEQSPFVTAGLDWMLFRLPENGLNWYTFGSGDYTRYLTAHAVHYEATALAQTQIKKELNEFWELIGTAQYFYVDQVFDVSSLFREFTSLKVQGHTLSAQPAIRRNLPFRNWVQVEFDAERDFFGKVLDDYWEEGPKLSLGHAYGHESELAFSYEFHERMYDRRVRRDPFGFPLTGALRLSEHELGLALHHFWDHDRHWQTWTRVFLQRNLDNGAGFYDFWRTKFSQQLRYRTPRWEARTEIALVHYDYDVQTISETNLERRTKSILTFGLRGEYSLRKSLKLFSRYEYERSLSNIRTDEYAVNTVQAGLEMEF